MRLEQRRCGDGYSLNYARSIWREYRADGIATGEAAVKTFEQRSSWNAQSTDCSQPGEDTELRLRLQERMLR